MGKVVGTIRRMGQEFQREINKTTGLDTVTDLRKSITEPLKKTTAEIRKEFNAIGSNGTVKPTGAIKPTDPKVESVVDSIKTAGRDDHARRAGQDRRRGRDRRRRAAATASSRAGEGRRPAQGPRAPTAPVAVADLPTIEASTPATPEPVAKTPRKRVAKPKPVESPAPIEAIAPAGRQARAQAAQEGHPRRARAAARARGRQAGGRGLAHGRRQGASRQDRRRPTTSSPAARRR